MYFWAYMLRCADGRYYTGHTDDLDRRIGQHQTGGHCKFTSTRRPVTLVWCECFASRMEALEAERIVGGWSRAKKEALIAGDWKRVGHFAKPPSERAAAPEQPTTPPFVSSEARLELCREIEKPDHDRAARQGVSTSLDTNGGGDGDPITAPAWPPSPPPRSLRA